MVMYRRHRVTGGIYFFTVTLKDRISKILEQYMGLLYESLRQVKQEMPYKNIAWVILPDHMHMVWVLPNNPVKHGYVDRVID